MRIIPKALILAFVRGSKKLGGGGQVIDTSNTLPNFFFSWSANNIGIEKLLYKYNVANFALKFDPTKELRSSFPSRFPECSFTCQLGYRRLGVGKTSRYLLRVVMLAFLFPSDSKASHPDFFGALERGEKSVLLPSLKAYTEDMAARQHRTRGDLPSVAASERAVAACGLKGVVSG